MSPTIVSSDQLKQNSQSDMEEIDKLEKTLKGSRRILFHARTVFPFDLFPDDIIIDENKIDIISGIFFFSQEVTSIPLSKIINARSTSTILFGELAIELESYHQNPLPVKYLWKKDAIQARRVINGLVTLSKQNINISGLDLVELKSKVEEIGKASEDINRS